jgi:hypothetical protein
MNAVCAPDLCTAAADWEVCPMASVSRQAEGEDPMNYSKPELTILGTAKQVIEIIYNVKLHFYRGDGIPGEHNLPAYDLDE